MSGWRMTDNIVEVRLRWTMLNDGDETNVFASTSSEV